MPLRKNNNQSPPDVMTWTRASPVLAICLVFDALRFLFEQFWFFGPALTALYCTNKVSSTVGATVGEFLCSSVSTALDIGFSEGFGVFGVVMAMAVGLFGWLTVGLILIKINPRIFKENAGHTVWFVVSLLISEVPIVGTVPALTITMWRLYHTQIKKDKEVLKQYESEHAATLQKERQERAAELMHIRAAQLEQAEAEQETEEIPEEMREAA